MIDSARLPIPVDELATGARLLARLPRFLRRPVRPDEARRTVQRRLEHREADFLALIGRVVYANPDSPYRALLGLAGCEPGDLESLVCREGLEGALRALYRSGVYLTVEEFKGRRPAVRGSATLEVTPGRLRNPAAAAHVLTHSSGSRGARTPIPLDLANVRDRAVNAGLHFEARGGSDWVYGIWGFPGGWPINRLLQYSFHAWRGNPPVRWFMNLDGAAPGALDLRYRLSAGLLLTGGLLARVPLPSPRPVSMEDPSPIIRWLAEVLRSGRTPHLHFFSSWAVRLCRTAAELGVDLTGAQFMCGGEPMTAARQEVIRRAGAVAVPLYGIDEVGGLISHGCLAPDAPDDGHLYHDLNALVQADPDDAAGPLPPRASLLTTLRRTAPLILLNVSTGDRAEVLQRSCGCPLERLGWTTHLRTIRSFEKLSAGGMTLLDADIVGILEDGLPRRFGGGPTDYQLLEDEAEDGKPRLRLLVHPRLGPLDEAALAEAFLVAVGGVDGGRRTEFMWRQAGFLGVERREPHRTASGKIHHLHQERRPTRSY